MIGININSRERDYANLIIDGIKTIETRNRPTLDAYIGRRVGIIRTGCGPARLVGYATIAGRIEYGDHSEFDAAGRFHLVTPYSEYYKFTGPVKYGYIITDPRPLAGYNTVIISSRGNVARTVPDEIIIPGSVYSDFKSLDDVTPGMIE